MLDKHRLKTSFFQFFEYQHFFLQFILFFVQKYWKKNLPYTYIYERRVYACFFFFTMIEAQKKKKHTHSHNVKVKLLSLRTARYHHPYSDCKFNILVIYSDYAMPHSYNRVQIACSKKKKHFFFWIIYSSYTLRKFLSI